MDFLRAGPGDLEVVTVIAEKLWSDHDPAECRQHFTEILSKEDCPVFLCRAGDKAIGFCEYSTRHDYVEGTKVHPVAYLEGIYVLEEYRLSGVGKSLLALGEQWAHFAGCSQMASDCEIDNTDSLAFHLRCGFSEANRIICFVKNINNQPTQPGASHAHHD